MCKCDPIQPGANNCQALHKENDEKLREYAITYRDLQTCQLAEEGAKGFYNVWCMFKSLIAQVCWLTDLVKDLKAPKLPDLSKYITKQEAEQTYQKKLTAGNNITISGNTISATVPAPREVDLSGYVPKIEYDKVKGALDKIIANLESSGAWQGGITGNFKPNRNIATGNINVFGGQPDGNSFIRTNNGQTENDLAGGI